MVERVGEACSAARAHVAASTTVRRRGAIFLHATRCEWNRRTRDFKSIFSKEGRERNGKCREKLKTCSISPSRVVPHRSTTDTRGSLTSLFGWEAVTLPDVAARGNHGRKVIYKASTFCNALPSFTQVPPPPRCSLLPTSERSFAVSPETEIQHQELHLQRAPPSKSRRLCRGTSPF